MFTCTTDGIVVEYIILYNIIFSLFCFYFNLIGSCVILFHLFQFIMFIQLYPDVVGNYVIRLYDVINLYGRWNSHYFILF